MLCLGVERGSVAVGNRGTPERIGVPVDGLPVFLYNIQSEYRANPYDSCQLNQGYNDLRLCFIY